MTNEMREILDELRSASGRETIETIKDEMKEMISKKGLDEALTIIAFNGLVVARQLEKVQAVTQMDYRISDVPQGGAK